MAEQATFTREGYLDENYHYFHLNDYNGQEREFHFHDFDKLVILFGGKVEYLVENVSCHLQPWDLLLVPRHTIHKALIDTTVPYERVIIYMDRKFLNRVLPDALMGECFERADSLGFYRLTPDRETRTVLQGLLQAFERELAHTVNWSDVMRDTLMMQLMVQVNRLAEAASPGKALRSYDPKIEQTLSYINENLSADLNVDLLADRVFLSRYHFMRLFKAQTGTTVHAYIRQKRLMYASRLIRAGMPANKAAADCGFNDYSTFHRAFTETFGISPGNLKK